jgi:mono/diheme cytochrome c family protein
MRTSGACIESSKTGETPGKRHLSLLFLSTKRAKRPSLGFSALLLAGAALSAQTPAPQRALLDRYCVGCHNEKAKTAGLLLDKLDVTHPGENPETWEKVVRKVRAGMMPPSGAPRPDRTQLDAFAAKLETELDRAAALRPNPGNPGLHRLNRIEYANAIRDLLGLDIDAATLLPADDSSEGFDNIADALAISPALVERYAAAAVKISRLAVGDPLITPSTATYRVPADLSQGDHLEGLPLGTRGGILVHHNFPLDAEYNFKIRAKAANIGLGQTTLAGEELEVTLNGERIKLVPAVTSLDLKIPVKAGPTTVGVAFVSKPPPGADEIWQTFPNNSGVTSIAITGPFNPTGPGDTASRRHIFVCKPSSESEEAPCAKKILTALARRAYRQPPEGADLDTLLSFYQSGRKNGDFESGIEQAVSRVLVDPRFVFRFERNPASVADGSAYRVTDLELASRLSFFLWSSIPDDELLDVAIQGKLHDPAVLEHQTRRMLADARSETLVTNFGGQWLYLRELKNARPEAREFNDNLRQSFRRETELFLDSILREDRSVTDLLNADYTFVDETLARHYGIPNIHGSRFRRVTVTEDARRGLLGQASFLLVTSVANRTSPVARGKWILENLLGTAPPLPPPNVPPLKDNDSGVQPTSLRQKMEEHRNNPTCAACHKIMDPIGFSLENFDLIGRWRSTEGDSRIDASGQLVDGTKLDGPASLRQALLSRSDVFVQTMTEKLLIYATGRALKYYDMPVVRAIDRDAGRNDNRFSSLILGIVKSEPFQMRVKQAGGKV